MRSKSVSVRRPGMLIGVALLSLCCSTAAQAQDHVDDAPKCNVVLSAAVDAIGPDAAFELAVQFQLAPGWHIYWKNSGDSGQPPRVTWKAPPGFVFGELQFPVPKRHVSAGNIVTNIHEGEPTLLVEVAPPAILPGETVSIEADVRYLICNETCLLETANVRVELPVDAGVSEPKPANEALFARARKTLPSPSSRYITVLPQVKPEPLAAGKPFELVVEIDIQRGIHIQSNNPLNPAFIPCEVFLERVEGAGFGEPVYPPAKFRDLKFVGKVSEFEGKVPVRFTGKLESDVPSGPLSIAGLVKYQACDAKGTCFPPDAVAFERTVSVGDTSRSATTIAPVDAEASVPDSLPSASDSMDAGLAVPPEGGFEGFLQRFGLTGILIGCFLYGLIINATPCVLPLLSIKVLGFVQQAHESRQRAFSLALAFGAGVIIFFVILGSLASRGQNMLGNPIAVIVLGAVVMALALSMLGVYTLQPPSAATMLDANMQREGLATSFGKGALAPVLGLACTAPFMAGMFAVASQQPPMIAFLAFAVTGLGMASPYVLLGAFPHWLSFLPKPGNWMITFERIMGFLLLAMTVLLLHPLTVLIGVPGLEWTLVFLVVVGMGCWLWGKINYSMSTEQRLKYRVGAVSLIAAGAAVIYGWAYPLGPAQERIRMAGMNGGYAMNGDSPIDWRPWSEEAVREAVLSGKPVFVDFTAAYCTNCKVNKAVAINQPETVEKLKSLGVATFQGDFTDNDPEIFASLQKHRRAGVPLNLLYLPGRPDDPIVFPVLFLKSYIAEQLDRVGHATAVSAAALKP